MSVRVGDALTKSMKSFALAIEADTFLPAMLKEELEKGLLYTLIFVVILN